MIDPLFTVFTPTYNRAHTLERVYESLLAQTFKSFEWIIVDDGSIDTTYEIVRRLVIEDKMTIRYFSQANSGKHVAFNLGVEKARGELFLTLDSDDSCIATALERFDQAWSEISEPSRSKFSGITCLCKDEYGKIVGRPLPRQTLEGVPYKIISKYRLKGEKWGFHRTEILKKFPFPVFSGERFIPESLVWNRIGNSYQIKFINEALRNYFNSNDSLTKSTIQIRKLSPNGTFLYYFETLHLQLPVQDLIRASANLWRFSIHNGQVIKIFQNKRRVILLTVGFFIGGGLFVLDKFKSILSK